MNADIHKYVAECDTCQRNKAENISSLGLLHPLHIPNQKWEEISMDFIEGLPISEGKYQILLVVDRLTKYAHFIGVKKKLILQRKPQKPSVKISTSYMVSPRLS